ncbi:MAG: hypothetical protein HFJ26_01750 [Clostridia bacterium]|nr:hypothetical protein [Clostridia bacterium]
MKIDMLLNGHNFQKQNLTTLRDSKGSYDLYVCSKYGVQGKKRELGSEIEIRNNSSKEYCIQKPRQGKIVVKALCTNDSTSFVDTFNVKSVKTAEQEVKAMIDWFNNTLRPYETPRKFVRIESIKK